MQKDSFCHVRGALDARFSNLHYEVFLSNSLLGLSLSCGYFDKFPFKRPKRREKEDGGWYWDFAGYINMPSGWPSQLALLSRNSKNTFLNSRRGDRNPFLPVINHISEHRWHDINPLTKQWELTREVMGDETDAFTVTGNNMVTPWSNPSTTKSTGLTNLSILLTGQSGDVISTQIFSNYQSALNLPPSPVQNLKVEAINYHPHLSWDAPTEEDLLYGSYKIYSGISSTNTEPASYSLLQTLDV